MIFWILSVKKIVFSILFEKMKKLEKSRTAMKIIYSRAFEWWYFRRLILSSKKVVVFQSELLAQNASNPTWNGFFHDFLILPERYKYILYEQKIYTKRSEKARNNKIRAEFLYSF